MSIVKGFIYKIYSPSHLSDGIYIGSTTETIDKRLRGHKEEFKYFLSGKRRTRCSSYLLIQYDDVVIEIIEECECSEEELRFKEGVYISTMPECINKKVPGRTKEEYRKIIIECEYCKKKVSKAHLSEHHKTLRCIECKDGKRIPGQIKTPKDYTQKWREKNREQYNKYMKNYRIRKLELDDKKSSI